MADSLSGKILKSFKQMFAGLGVKTVLSIVSNYFYALLLGPGVYGIWQTARIIISYASFVNLGMPFYVQREYPSLKKEEKIKEANQLAHLVISFSFVSFPIIGILILGLALYIPNDFEFTKSMIAIAMWFVLVIPAGIGTIINKAVNDYKTVGIGESIFGIGSLAMVPFIYYYGFNALLLGFIITTIVQSWYYFAHRPIKYKWYWNSSLLKGMIFTAFPIFLVNIAASIYASADRVIIASMLDFKDVGLYSLSSFISIPISLVVTSFSSVLFTQLNEKYGRNREPHIIEKQVFLPQRIFSNLLPPIIGMGLIAMPVFTQLFLPKYQGGISAAQINIFAIFFYVLAGFSSNALFVLNKQKLSALSFLIAGFVKIGGSIAAISLGFGISGVAFFSVIGYFIYDSLMLYFVSKNIGYKFVNYLKSLMYKLVCPVIILIASILYVGFQQMVYNKIGLHNLWIQLLIGELFIVLIGATFFVRAYKIIMSYVKGNKI